MKNFEICTYGNTGPLLIQMVDSHDLDLLDREIGHIKDMTGGQDFQLKAILLEDWNRDLSPWKAPAVFGKEDFGGEGEETLKYLLKNVIPARDDSGTGAQGKLFIGGYSLAGLFALWASCNTDSFDGIAAASPSIWFPDFTDYLKENPPAAKSIYLSLGDREERTKNPVMARVGQAIRESYSFLEASGKTCTLEWNKGNHFKNSDLRTARAFAWLMNQDH